MLTRDKKKVRVMDPFLATPTTIQIIKVQPWLVAPIELIEPSGILVKRGSDYQHEFCRCLGHKGPCWVFLHPSKSRGHTGDTCQSLPIKQCFVSPKPAICVFVKDTILYSFGNTTNRIVWDALVFFLSLYPPLGSFRTIKKNFQTFDFLLPSRDKILRKFNFFLAAVKNLL